MTHYQSLLPTDDSWKWPVDPAVPAPLRSIASNIDQAKMYIRRGAAGLQEEHLWKRLTGTSLSIGNLLLHFRGTEHQWIGQKLGGLPLDRDRDLEMNAAGGFSLEELLAALDETDRQSRDILTRLTEDDLARTYTEQQLSAEFILHYTAQHLAYHAGQLILLRKCFEPGFLLFP
ncbi:DinB family protein [Gorillibacterium sp. sgz5001074]|uniref:DinB family protein n=1 Tax=Gorillibacterium sp. sgz5001074 TaxID=3446695 RepID=UPI003F66FD73